MEIFKKYGKVMEFRKNRKKYGNLKKECGKHGKCTESIKICHKIILFSKETMFFILLSPLNAMKLQSRLFENMELYTSP